MGGETVFAESLAALFVIVVVGGGGCKIMTRLGL